MTETMTEVAVGGTLALLILREAFGFVFKLKDKLGGANGRRSTDKMKNVQNGVDAVLSRLDRIVERLEDIADNLRYTKKLAIINNDRAERLSRQTEAIEETVNDIALAHRRKTDTQPGIS